MVKIFSCLSLEMTRNKKTESINQKDQEENQEITEEKPEVRINKKTGKPLLSKEELHQVRLTNLKRAEEAKRLKREQNAKKEEEYVAQVPIKKEVIEEVPIKQETTKPVKVNNKSKPKPKTKIIYENDDEDSDDEYEKVIVRRKKNKPVKVIDEDDYVSMIKKSTTEQIQRNLENERIKMLMSSISSSYRFKN